MSGPKRRLANAVGLAGAVCLAVQPALAGSTWLSSVTIKENGRSTTIPASASSLKGPAFGSLQNMAPDASSSATAVFNLSISLEANPQGDDQYPEDDAGGVDDSAQVAYEERIEEFADAVYQMTNGAHKIGTVTVFRDGAQANNADVQWKEDCTDSDPTTTAPGPRASPSGFGVPGDRIYMCTNWEGAPTLMSTPKGSGFTLAHEWGHYTLGIFDEYVSNCGKTPETSCVEFFPRSTDTASSPSIMHNQWNAARSGGDADWLEFSTSDVEPYASSTGGDGDDKNGQARVFGEPVWDTLTRSTTNDPRHSYTKDRVQYTTLTAPTAPNFLVNDDESDARSDLDIVWAGSQVVELMIDRSGSMGGTPIANARTAASLLVGQLTPGANAVGVGAFTGSASQVFAIADIPDPDTGVITGAQNAIAALTSGGSTDIEEAALLALQETQNFQGGNRPSVVYLLTDGQSFVDEANVISEYTAANVPLITFGFGSGVDSSLLQNLANGTGGSYFFSPTSLAEIQQAFVAANAAVSSSVVVNSATAPATGNATEVRTLQFDSTLSAADINVTYDGPESDITLALLDASGTDTGIAFTCNADAEVSCNATVDVAAEGAGEYGVEITNTVGTDKDVSVLVSGTPSTFESYDMAVQFDNANYPESLILRSSVSKGPPLSGLDVTADVTRPDGTVVQVALLDDGNGADRIADDGNYTAILPYDANGDGTYTAVVSASNPQGNAQTTFEGAAITVTEDGNGATPTPESVTENFTRVSVANASVAGAQSDDHADDPTVPGACTLVNDDNSDTLGRIDFAGDVDCFFFTPSSTDNSLFARITSLYQGMDPVIRVFDATGATELLQFDLASSPNPDSGAISEVPADSLDAAGHVITVAHADDAATSGNYAASIGSQLTSDQAPDGPGDTDTGGAVGPLGLLIAAIMALLGLRQRRVKV